MTPYIDIHTHFLPKDNNVFLFNNRFGSKDKMYQDSIFSVGIHPWDSSQEISTSELEQLISHKNCLAIGECGLDKLNGPELFLQKRVFEYQLNLAVKYQKPVIVHCVKAFDELIEICELYKTKISVIIHGFNKSQQLAKQLIDKGFYLSFSDSVFKKKDFDFKTIPIKKIFLETDNNETLLIKDVYALASNYFNIKENDLKEKIYSNFNTVFGGISMN